MEQATDQCKEQRDDKEIHANLTNDNGGADP